MPNCDRRWMPNHDRFECQTAIDSDAILHPNMKELRVQFAGEPIRAFFAFDPNRMAIVLCAGNKAGQNEKRFYKDMINLADSEYSKHIRK
ncbi:type II toxin-antitoxin system RelE/ParE family toxin [Escherichia coli]|nr:type II toxin-antitoxin system RelE/ParE family toxin [Escherichia coli]HDX5688452.1 type II toxin-antitoxin system RelE/ParE family toxin [Escherichia coli]